MPGKILSIVRRRGVNDHFALSEIEQVWKLQTPKQKDLFSTHDVGISLLHRQHISGDLQIPQISVSINYVNTLQISLSHNFPIWCELSPPSILFPLFSLRQCLNQERRRERQKENRLVVYRTLMHQYLLLPHSWLRIPKGFFVKDHRVDWTAVKDGTPQWNRWISTLRLNIPSNGGRTPDTRNWQTHSSPYFMYSATFVNITQAELQRCDKPNIQSIPPWTWRIQSAAEDRAHRLFTLMHNFTT